MAEAVPFILPGIVSLLGPQIGDLAGDFLSTRTGKRPNLKSTFHTGLAPSFGTLQTTQLKELDKELSTIIAVTTNMIADIAPEERSWENVIAALQQNPVLKPMKDTIHKSSGYSLKSFTLLAGDGKPDPISMAKVRSWFTNFIGDPDVMDSTEIDIGWCEYTVCQTGAAVKNILDVLAKSQKIQRELVDIGVLRYPTKQCPYFKVFRIQLNVWAETKRVFSIQTDNNGVIAEFSCRRYEALSAVINRLSSAVIGEAVDQVASLLGRNRASA